MEFVYGDKNRIFINLTLGCASRCSYCYLPNLGLKLGEIDLPSITPAQAVSLVKKNKHLIKGKQGTILSIGCYSECFDRFNKNNTLKLIKALLEYKNPIQIATKRKVDVEDIKSIIDCIDWKGQLTLFISSATLADWNSLERGTDPPSQRFLSFKNISINNIPTFLYLKPILDKITRKSLSNYRNVIKTNKPTGTIVGELFLPVGSKQLSRSIAPIAEGRLACKPSSEILSIGESFSDITVVFKHSTEAVDFWRNLSMDYNTKDAKLIATDYEVIDEIMHSPSAVTYYALLLRLSGYSTVSHYFNESGKICILAGMDESDVCIKLILDLKNNNLSGQSLNLVANTLNALKIYFTIPDLFELSGHEELKRLVKKKCEEHNVSLQDYKRVCKNLGEIAS